MSESNLSHWISGVIRRNWVAQPILLYLTILRFFVNFLVSLREIDYQKQNDGRLKINFGDLWEILFWVLAPF